MRFANVPTVRCRAIDMIPCHVAATRSPPRVSCALTGRQPMYKRALVPLDGSRLAEGILPFLLQIAGPLAPEVALVYVVRPLGPPIVEENSRFTVYDPAAKLAEARDYLAP